MEKKFIKQQDMVKRVKRECKVMKSTGRSVAADEVVRISIMTHNHTFLAISSDMETCSSGFSAQCNLATICISSWSLFG
jgi:hypothetical protein